VQFQLGQDAIEQILHLAHLLPVAALGQGQGVGADEDIEEERILTDVPRKVRAWREAAGQAGYKRLGETGRCKVLIGQPQIAHTARNSSPGFTWRSASLAC
jgi:hypothetical protein